MSNHVTGGELGSISTDLCVYCPFCNITIGVSIIYNDHTFEFAHWQFADVASTIIASKTRRCVQWNYSVMFAFKLESNAAKSTTGQEQSLSCTWKTWAGAYFLNTESNKCNFEYPEKCVIACDCVPWFLKCVCDIVLFFTCGWVYFCVSGRVGLNNCAWIRAGIAAGTMGCRSIRRCNCDWLQSVLFKSGPTIWPVSHEGLVGLRNDWTNFQNIMKSVQYFTHFVLTLRTTIYWCLASTELLCTNATFIGGFPGTRPKKLSTGPNSRWRTKLKFQTVTTTKKLTMERKFPLGLALFCWNMKCLPCKHRRKPTCIRKLQSGVTTNLLGQRGKKKQ